MAPRRLKEYRIYEIKLRCITGLRIGGTKEVAAIGECDNPIIRDPLTRKPYIPGSSLKGKLRSLLELTEGKYSNNGGPCSCGTAECNVCTLFGVGAQSRSEQMEDSPENGKGVSMPRLIFRDLYLTCDSKQLLRNCLDGDYTEEKTEVTIDRSSGKAIKGGLRSMERVPAGAEFEGKIAMRVFEDDDAEKHEGLLTRTLELLEYDYLGGCGTRGYGQIQIEIVECKRVSPDNKVLIISKASTSDSSTSALPSEKPMREEMRESAKTPQKRF